jgi:hypothetical protein
VGIRTEPVLGADSPVERERRGVAYMQYSFLTVLLLGIGAGIGGGIAGSGVVPIPPISASAWIAITVVLTLVGSGFQGLLYRGQWIVATGAVSGVPFENEYRGPLQTVTRVQIVILVIATLLAIVDVVQNPGASNPTSATVSFSTLGLVHLGVTLVRGVVDLLALLPLFTTVRRVAERQGDAVLARRAGRNRIAIPIWGTVGILAIGLRPLIAMVLYYNTLNSYRALLRESGEGHPEEPLAT